MAPPRTACTRLQASHAGLAQPPALQHVAGLRADLHLLLPATYLTQLVFRVAIMSMSTGLLAWPAVLACNLVRRSQLPAQSYVEQC
jgi:hypothetical protein